MKTTFLHELFGRNTIRPTPALKALPVILALALAVMMSVPALGEDAEDLNRRLLQLANMAADNSDYRLGRGDLIEVSVFGVDTFDRVVRVNANGQVTLPFLGAVDVAGLTVFELEEKLSAMLDGRFIKNPQVTAFIREYHSQQVLVLGAVQKPGQYQMNQQLRLADALAMAGGLDLARASEYALVQRRNPELQSSDSQSDEEMGELIRVDLRELLTRGQVSLNIPVQGGDIIQVPEREIELFYVIGDVNSPGVFELPEEQEIYLTQALAWAGGHMKTASLGRSLLVRYEDGGKRVEVPLDLSDIISGKRADMTIRPNDVLFVPSSTAKNIGFGFLGAVPGAVTGAAVWGPIRRISR